NSLENSYRRGTFQIYRRITSDSEFLVICSTSPFLLSCN
ncbi:mCG1048852, partial [Mus musculus]